MGKGKRRWWKKISGFRKSKKKKMEQLKRMDEIQRLAESDKESARWRSCPRIWKRSAVYSAIRGQFQYRGACFACFS